MDPRDSQMEAINKGSKKRSLGIPGDPRDSKNEILGTRSLGIPWEQHRPKGFQGNNSDPRDP